MSEDRTQEFLILCQSAANSGVAVNPALHSLPTTIHDNTTTASHNGTVAGRYGGRYGASAPRNDSTDDATNELRQFHSTASDISRDIAATSALLSELTQLVRRRTLFDDDNDRVNWLVLRIKSNVEGLNGRLDDAGQVISRQKRRLGRNSQAGQEASNLVGQLQEEFVRATTGFKKILQHRSDNLKVSAERKREVMGAGSHSDPASRGGCESLVLQNKPAVYGDATAATGGKGGGGGMGGSFLEANATPGGGGLQPLGGPRLDLTGAFMARQNAPENIPAGESSSSASQLPRPRK